ncbi:hypothetical protein BP6252_00081 [Coleophoma cylindrospora]|uniref:Zn(2)-C6 fungal-type domain-containing protein n=1 Tax=Coleophoma cylindrospora TaxID=1849047 RepID=A0A3D8SNZ3_9HELO|nr:hypothetical protein BP6252_00081 [Coleophoma cylindrospora]
MTDNMDADVSDRPFVCIFCQRAFKRSDTRRLHYSRCRSRISTGVHIPPAAQKGRKPRACDACAQRKRACDLVTPCSQCVSRKLVCTRIRMSSATPVVGSESKPAKASTSDPSVEGEADDKPTFFSDPAHFKVEADLDAPSDVLPQIVDQAAFFETPPNAVWSQHASTFDASHFHLDRAVMPTSSASIPSTTSVAKPLHMDYPLPPNTPLNFLFNFTTSKGMASSFNFAFYKSRHKSKNFVAYSFGPWPEVGFNDQNYVDSSAQFISDFMHQDVSSWYNFNGNPPSLLTYVSDTSTISSTDSTYQYEHASEAPSHAGLIHPIEHIRRDSTNRQSPPRSDNPELSNAMLMAADPLFDRTREICVSLQNLVATTPMPVARGQSPGMDRAQSSRCLSFFAPQNLRKYINLFWDDWYPHSPILHRPTFNEKDCSISLLLSMVLIGAALSPDRDDSLLAQEWFDLAEELAFREATSEHTFEGLICEANKVKLQKPSSLQAAFWMCCLQNWEGNVEAKTRFARGLGFGRATHEAGKSWTTNDFDWHSYAAVEELIRTFSFIFLVDSSYVIFNNAPSRLLLHELTFDLQSPSECFYAPDSQSCLYELQRLVPAGCLRSRLSFSDSVQILHQNSFDEATSDAFLQLDSLNLFSIVSAVYTSLYIQQSSLFGVSQLSSSIRNTLATWQILWNARSDLPSLQALELKNSIQPWKRVGFFQHADEYRLFALGVLELIEKRRRAFAKYDETSMDQVARLLCSMNVEPGK